MKNTYHLYVFILIIAAIVLSAGYAASDERMVETFSVKSGQKLDIDLKCGGGVHIEGWDENRVEVAYYERHGDLEDLEWEEAELEDEVAEFPLVEMAITTSAGSTKLVSC